MAEYHLPAGPAELLETARQTIGKYLGGEHHLCLGGGTALAARWGHRHSTDVDLFVTPGAFKGLFENRDAFRRELYAMVAEPASIHVNEGFAKILVGKAGQEISIDTSEPRTDDPRSDDTVRGTNIPLETNGEILAKKIRYRMLGNAEIVPRDLYDIAVSRRLDPGALKTALEGIDTPQLEDINNELHYLRPDFMGHGQQKRLIRPVYPEDAADAVAIVRRQFRQEIDSRTPRPYRPPPAWER